jgi:transposase
MTGGRIFGKNGLRERWKKKLLLNITDNLELHTFGSDIMTVSSAAGISRYTIENWFDKYLTEGIDSINTFDYKPKQPYLNISQINQVVIWVTFGNPENTKQVREYIHEKFGISYSCEAVRQFLKKRGLAVIRPETHPGSPPSVEEQKQFIDEYFRMKYSGPPGSVTLFGDAMHLVHNNVPGLCRGDPKFLPVLDTNSGRKRPDILGAYNPDSHSFLHLTGEENCNAERVTEYLELIMKSFREMTSTFPLYRQIPPRNDSVFMVMDLLRSHSMLVGREMS